MTGDMHVVTIMMPGRVERSCPRVGMAECFRAGCSITAPFWDYGAHLSTPR